MIKPYKPLLLSFLCLLMGSCDMIDYHPYDVRINGETDVNAHNIAEIEQKCKDKTTIKFVTMGDSQRWYDETLDFVGEINKRDDIDFVIHGGDMSDFGVTDEFLWQRDIMNKLHVPYVALIGNHDCLGTGEETYRAVFGDPNFSFIAGRVKFVCLNTNAMEFDYSRPIPDFTFLEKELTDRKDEFDKTVVSMHVRPYADQFNNNVARVFHRYVTEFPGIQFCTAAHEHHVFEENLFEDGIMYYMSDCMKNRMLGKLDVDVEILPLIEVNEAFPAKMAPEEVAPYISRKKAHPYMAQLKDREILLTADTVVINRGEVLGKPTDAEDAALMLRLLSGHTHKVVTGVTLATKTRTVTFSEITEVDFAPLTHEEIDYYVAKYRPMDKAGAYGIQEWIGYIGISGIRGDYYNVMGLPLHALYTRLVNMANGFRKSGNR